MLPLQHEALPQYSESFSAILSKRSRALPKSFRLRSCVQVTKHVLMSSRTLEGPELWRTLTTGLEITDDLRPKAASASVALFHNSMRLTAVPQTCDHQSIPAPQRSASRVQTSHLDPPRERGRSMQAREDQDSVF